MFILNLAVADLLMMSSVGPPVVINAMVSDFWIFGKTLCTVYGFLGAQFGTVSIMTLVVIGWDRYNVIVKGFNGVKMTMGKALVILFFVWVYVALGSVPPFFGWGAMALGNSLDLYGHISTLNLEI